MLVRRHEINDFVRCGSFEGRGGRQNTTKQSCSGLVTHDRQGRTWGPLKGTWKGNWSEEETGVRRKLEPGEIGPVRVGVGREVTSAMCFSVISSISSNSRALI